jgi:hypothetical protein
LLYQHRIPTYIGRFRWLIFCIGRESPTSSRLVVASKSVQQVFEISAPGMVGRPDSRSRSASTTCGGMCHAGMPPCAAAAWPAAVDNVLTVGLRANVSQRRSAAGPCRHSLRRQAPRVGWGACRHVGGGLFCQFNSEVVLFVNELGRVVLLTKIRYLDAIAGRRCSCSVATRIAFDCSTLIGPIEA